MLERQVTLKKRIGTNIVSLFPTTTSELVKIGSYNLNTELSNVKSSIDSSVPIGTIITWYNYGTYPDGWLPLNGQEISRTVYPELFNIYGETFGAGDSSTTFNLPNKNSDISNHEYIIKSLNMYNLSGESGDAFYQDRLQEIENKLDEIDSSMIISDTVSTITVDLPNNISLVSKNFATGSSEMTYTDRLGQLEARVDNIDKSMIISDTVVMADNDTNTSTKSTSVEPASISTYSTEEQSQPIDTTNSALLNLPISSIIDYSANDLPNGYLYADGSKLLKTDYSDLYNAIGDTFTLQENIGTEYFNIPYVENLSDDVYKIIKVSKNSFVIDQVVYDDTNVVNSTVIANLLERIKVLEDALGI